MRLILGAAVIGLTICGCGGGGAPSTPASSSTESTQGTAPTQTTAPELVQMNTFQTTSNNGANNSPVQFKTVTAAGDTIWVAATVSDYGGIHTISVSDTQGNAYTLLDQENDGSPGTQTVAHFYASNIVGDTTAPDTVTVVWSNDNYKGVLIAEISGTTQAPLVGHSGNIQDGLGGGSNNVSSGAIEVATDQTPALLVALSMNTSGGTSDTGGSGFGGPAVGSGLTQVATLWDWGANLATFATGTVTGAESVSSLFSAQDVAPAVDSYVTVAAVFH